MDGFQRAILEQAIRCCDRAYAEDAQLLQWPEGADQPAIHESLCYAALLLAACRHSPNRSRQRRALTVIDRVLALLRQQSSFDTPVFCPLAAASSHSESPARRNDLADVTFSLMVVLANLFREELTSTRVTSLREAAAAGLKFVIRSDSEPSGSSHHALLRAWLEFEVGDPFNAQLQLVQATGQSDIHAARTRFADEEQYALELWGLALWSTHAELGHWAVDLLGALRKDLRSGLHPDHPVLFGALVSPPGRGSSIHGLSGWLSLASHGSAPILPQQLQPGIRASGYALPVLSRLLTQTAVLSDLQIPAQTDWRIPAPSGEVRAWQDGSLYLEWHSTAADVPCGRRFGVRWTADDQAFTLVCTSSSIGPTDHVQGGFILTDCGTAHLECRMPAAASIGLDDRACRFPGLNADFMGWHMAEAERQGGCLRLTLKRDPDHPTPAIRFSVPRP